MPQLEINGASIHYEQVGTGPPLLLIAGIASDSASWRPLVPLLSPHFSLVLIDNRGSGRSVAAGDLTVEQMVDDCAAVLSHVGLGPAEVVGHSLGGMIGLMLAARHPGRVSRLVTMTSGIITPSKRTLFRDMARLYFTMAPIDWFRLLYQWLFSDRFFASETMISAAAAGSLAYPFRQSPEDFSRQVAAIDRFKAIDLATVPCPVLSLSAELDLLASRESVEKLHEPIPDVRHGVIENAAHSIHWEAPQQVVAAIRGFLA